jgi:hypothetical protein
MRARPDRNAVYRALLDRPVEAEGDRLPGQERRAPASIVSGSITNPFER